MVNFLVAIIESIISPNPNNISATFEQINDFFLGIYTAEAILKISGLGLVEGPKSYLKNAWNVLDFIIVICGYLELFLSAYINISSIKTLRLLRPLRALTVF